MYTVMASLLLLGSAEDKSATIPIPIAPAPRVVVQPFFPPPPPMPTSFYRTSAYEVWQNLAVDRSGYFRPRVLSTPYGAFYRYNGEPYPWTSTKQYNFMPYASD